MKELLAEIELKRKYNKMPLKDVADEFGKYSDQMISHEIIERFAFTGLNNVDFLTSDYLTQHGLNNIYGV